MTDGSPPPTPPLTKATAAQLAEGRAKQAAYADERRRHKQAWDRRLAGLADDSDDAPEPVQGSPHGRRRSRARGKLHDPRQGNFDV